MTFECLTKNIEDIYNTRFRDQNKKQKEYKARRQGHGPEDYGHGRDNTVIAQW